MKHSSIRTALVAALMTMFVSACSSGGGGGEVTGTNDTVNPPPGDDSTAPTPFSGAPAALPGMLQAEDFDKGGEGVAYHDNVAGNAGGEYRPDEDVDIVVDQDSDGGQWRVQNFETGEWLAYSVDVASDESYTIELRASSAYSDSAYHVEVDGEDVTGTIDVPNTGGWEQYRWVGRSNVPLTAGKHLITIVSEQEYFNVTAIRADKTPDSGPYAGAPMPVPGTIEAEDFDFGGEGTAYHDSDTGNSGGQYRPFEDVDIATTEDADGGQYDVVGLAAGEWLVYTIDVAAAADYDVSLRAAADGASAARIEIDGMDVSGDLTVTPGAYAWAAGDPVTLDAGQHVVTVAATQGTLRVNRIQFTEAEPVAEPGEDDGPAAAPFNGVAAQVPGVIEAEDYDIGGEAVSYHDAVVGNAGGSYRPDEDVDIIPTTDSEGGGYDVYNFSNNEWMTWTIDVAADGDYDVQLRLSSVYDDAAYRVKLDGEDVSGIKQARNTGNWSAYQWTGVQNVHMTAGIHTVTLVSAQEYFNLNALRITESLPAAPSSGGGDDPQSVLFTCTFLIQVDDCGFALQSSNPDRASLIDIARDGQTGVILRTEPGDSNIAGSGNAERTDLYISQEATDGFEGSEGWWAHSIMFPDDFVQPPSGWGVVFDFHNTASGAWQANFHVDAGPNGLDLRGYGGVNNFDGEYGVQLGQIQRNVWYDFVYHVRWSSGNDGFMEAWVNGEKVLSHHGPTLYAGQGVYLKLANYHSPFGQSSSVIHDRVMHGSTPLAVYDGPLEDVLDIIDGILSPLLP